MHFSLFLPVVASLCSALVIPDQEVFEAVSKAYLGLEDNDHSRLVSTDAVNRDDESDIETWWEMASAITRNSHGAAADLVLSLLGLDSSFDGAVKFSQRGKDREDDDDGEDDGEDDRDDGDSDDDSDDDDDDDDDDDYRRPGFRRPGYHGPRRRPGFGHPSPDDSRACLPEMFCPANHTIWEIINESSRTSHLAELISDTDHLVNLLNSTVTNHTLFAPTNRALGRLLDERPPNKLLKRIEHYHVIPGLFATDKLRHQHQTLRTALNESALGENMPQRVVVNMRRNRLVLNRRSRIIAGNIRAQNGIIHHINIPLLPPPNTMTILDLLPDRFSTFALGLERTRLAAHFSKHKRAGGTTFAPTNAAFQRLGHRANAFLFSPQGEQCLRSLLQFHIVLNRTLYSDALYVKGDVREFRGNESSGSVHVKLPTVLRDHALNVDLARRGPGVEVRVNGFYRVVGLDLLASDGVLHVLDRVLIPPKSIGEMKWDGIEEDIEAEELKERLGGCMEDQSMARMEL